MNRAQISNSGLAEKYYGTAKPDLKLAGPGSGSGRPGPLAPLLGCPVINNVGPDCNWSYACRWDGFLPVKSGPHRRVGLSWLLFESSEIEQTQSDSAELVDFTRCWIITHNDWGTITITWAVMTVMALLSKGVKRYDNVREQTQWNVSVSRAVKYSLSLSLSHMFAISTPRNPWADVVLVRECGVDGQQGTVARIRN